MKRQFRWLIVAVTCGIVGSGASFAGAPQSILTQPPISIPFDLDHGRIIITVEFKRPDGSLRSVRAWVDSGNPDFLISSTLAQDLKLRLGPVGKDFDPGYGPSNVAAAPELSIAGTRIDDTGLQVIVPNTPGSLFPGVLVEANVPSTVLSRYAVGIDYGDRIFRLAPAGQFAPRGFAVPAEVNHRTGMLQIAARIDGHRLDLAVDTGASYSWVERAVTDLLISEGPARPHAIGATGLANLFGSPLEAQGLQVCRNSLALGGHRIDALGVLGVDTRMFAWYSKKTASPVKGFLGANVLQRFRLQLDYANAMTYWEELPSNARAPQAHIPLVLQPQSDGTYVIVGMRAKGRSGEIGKVRSGDRLLAIDGNAVQGWPMGSVHQALSSSAGHQHSIRLGRSNSEQILTMIPTAVCD